MYERIKAWSLQVEAFRFHLKREARSRNKKLSAGPNVSVEST